MRWLEIDCMALKQLKLTIQTLLEGRACFNTLLGDIWWFVSIDNVNRNVFDSQ